MSSVTRTVTVPTAEDMYALGRRLGGRLVAGDLVILSGALGAGKTTLTRGIGAGLQVRGPVTSPTFVLARTHPSLSGGPAMVHADAYRLGSAAELADLDIDFDGAVVVVEWGAGLLDGVNESWLTVQLDRALGADRLPVDDAADPRRVTITARGPRWQNDHPLRDAEYT